MLRLRLPVRPYSPSNALVDCVDFEELLLLLLLLFELLEKVSADAVPIRLIDINRVSSSFLHIRVIYQI